MAEPNQFTLRGEHTHITYSTTSISGQPQFHFQDQHHNITVSGQDIHSLDTEIGTLITVSVGVSALNNTRVALLVPQVRLPQDAHETPVKTIAILTTTQTEGIPPVRQTYHVLNLHGTAGFVAS